LLCRGNCAVHPALDHEIGRLALRGTKRAHGRPNRSRAWSRPQQSASIVPWTVRMQALRSSTTPCAKYASVSKSLKDQNALHREIRKHSVQIGRPMIRVTDEFGAALSRIPASRLVMIDSRAPLSQRDACAGPKRRRGAHQLVGVGTSRGQQRREPCGDP
jgi:hypothetical protein